MRLPPLLVCCLVVALGPAAAPGGAITTAAESQSAQPTLPAPSTQSASATRPAPTQPPALSAPAQSSGTGPAAQAGDPGFDPGAVVMRFHVRADGTALARVEYRLRLDDANSTAAFESFRRDVENDSARFVERFERRVRGTAATAENATGREMAVENVTVRTTTEQLPQSYGVVVYSFTWHGFAATDDGRLVVGDSLGGLYLDENTRLLVSWPDDYEATTVGANVAEEREHEAVWVGPRYFGRDGPRAVLAPEGGGLPSPAVLAVGAGALLALVGGAAWWRRRGRRATARSGAGCAATGPPSPEPSPGADVGVPEDEAAPTADPADPVDGAASADGAADRAAGESAADAEAAAGDDDSVDDPELLSNEERVVRVLEREGGRVKQQQVVEALGWSEAKTSRVVGTLREEGRVESFRLGNENVLSLPTDDEEVD